MAALLTADSASDQVREGGFTLVEAIVATLIATVAVIGLAYTFSTGRGIVTRYELRRAALAAAQGRMEALGVAPSTSPDLTIGSLHTAPFALDGRVLGEERWTVEWRDVPADGIGAADPDTFDLKLVSVEVVYSSAGVTDQVQLSRLLPGL